MRGSYTSWYVLLRTSWQPILQILSFSNLEGRHTLVYCSFCVSVTFPYLKNSKYINSYSKHNTYYVYYITYNSSAVKMKNQICPWEMIGNYFSKPLPLHSSTHYLCLVQCTSLYLQMMYSIHDWRKHNLTEEFHTNNAFPGQFSFSSHA